MSYIAENMKVVDDRVVFKVDVVGGGLPGPRGPKGDPSSPLLENVNHISIPNGSSPAITRTSGDEALIREIGNVVFDKNTNQYIFTYTGTRTPYVEDQCWIYWATSPDLKVWTKRGKCTGQGAEDPYLVIEGNTYYLFVEHKDLDHPSAHAGVGLWKGDSMSSLTFQGVVLEHSETGWDSGDVSSPTMHLDGGLWYMFYEGRQWPIDNQRGAIGLATSSSLDGPWTKMTESSPLISGTQIDPDTPVQWAYSLVPDDIIKSGDKYYLSFHAESNGPYVTSILMSDSLASGWVDPIGQWFTKDLSGQDVNGAGFMLVQHNGKLMTMSNQGNGVYVAELTNKSTGSWYYRTVPLSASSELHSVAGGNKNEIIQFNLNTDKTFGWRSNKAGKAGVVKKLVNKTDFSLTIQPESGVRINNLTTGYIIKPQTTVDFILTAVDRWEVLFIYDHKEFLSKSIEFGSDINGDTTLSEDDNSKLREITSAGQITLAGTLTDGWNIQLVNISEGVVEIVGDLRFTSINKLVPGKGCVIYKKGGVFQTIGLEE